MSDIPEPYPDKRRATCETCGLHSPCIHGANYLRRTHTIVGVTIQSSNSIPLEDLRRLREGALQDYADREDLHLVDDERFERIEYGTMVPTGEMFEYEDGELVPGLRWEPQPEGEAKQVRIQWEARALPNLT